MRSALRSHAQPLPAAPGRCRRGRTPPGDRADGTAAVLRPARLPAPDLRRAGPRSDRPLPAAHARVDGDAGGHRGRPGRACRRPADERAQGDHQPLQPAAAAHGAARSASGHPRVLGVDDFAVKRGQVYGTVLTDCETGAPIELLAGREAAPLAEWLTRHPGVEVICRDRSGSYAEGARLGAADAVQVADRFHLWQNLAKAPEQPEQPTAPAPAEEAPPVGRFAERARRHHALVHGLLAQGHGLRAIARHLGWGRHTVQRYARAVTWQELVDGKWRQPRPSKLDPFKPYLQQRWEQGCRNAAQLYREVGARGFAGSYALVRSYLDAYRVRPDPAAPPPPTVRQVTGWLTRHPATLTEDDQVRLKAVLEQCPELRSAAGHVRAFGEMLTKLRGQELPAWIAAVRAEGLPGLTAFADSLTSDLDAVTRGLTTRWNSGPIEGRVNHIKMLKRQMFGRASLPLLRKRVLLTASR